MSEHIAAHGLDFEAVGFCVGSSFGQDDLGLGSPHFRGGLRLGDGGDFRGFGLGEGAEFDRFGFAGRLKHGGRFRSLSFLHPAFGKVFLNLNVSFGFDDFGLHRSLCRGVLQGSAFLLSGFLGCERFPLLLRNLAVRHGFCELRRQNNVGNQGVF